MPKSFYANETDIPENQKGAYAQKNGRWELTDLDDEHPAIIAKKSLETTQKTLKREIGELGEKVTLAESKVLDDGKVAVTPEIKELGEAAQTAGLKKGEMGTYKTKITELEGKVNSYESEKSVDEVLSTEGLNGRFRKMALDKGLKFEKGTEKQDGKDVEFFSVVKEDGTKVKVKEFITSDDYFKEFADTFTDNGKPPIRRFNQQFPDNKQVPTNKYDAIEQEVKERNKPAQAAQGSISDRFYNRKQAE